MPVLRIRRRPRLLAVTTLGAMLALPAGLAGARQSDSGDRNRGGAVRAQTARPTIVLLHGGGWQSGSPATMRAWQTDFEAHGYRVVSMAYPLGGIARSTDSVRQQVRALPKPVITYGISAGGTISATLAARGEVAGAVNLLGPTDFTTLSSPGVLLITAQLGMTRAQRRAASPIYMLAGQQSPQLLQFGSADPIITADQGISYARAARQGQPDTTLQLTANAHGQWAAQRAEARNWVAARWPAGG